MKIRLTVLSGGTEGTRLKVQSSPYVIGRGDQCDLRLNSRSISRRHCALVHHNKRVMIQDLGSRNHTIVGYRILQSGQACRLFHGDEIQVGKVRFRVSIRDRQTNQPIVGGDEPSGIVQLSSIAIGKPAATVAAEVPADKDAASAELVPSDPATAPEDLLNELDSLVDQQQLVEFLTVESASDQALTRRWSSSTVSENSSPGDLDEEDSTDMGPLTKSDTTTQAMAVAGEKSVPDSQEETVEAEPIGPRKIPAHLRPKPPADSQDAASEALRRMFSGGR